MINDFQDSFNTEGDDIGYGNNKIVLQEQFNLAAEDNSDINPGIWNNQI